MVSMPGLFPLLIEVLIPVPYCTVGTVPVLIENPLFIFGGDIFLRVVSEVGTAFRSSDTFRFFVLLSQKRRGAFLKRDVSIRIGYRYLVKVFLDNQVRPRS